MSKFQSPGRSAVYASEAAVATSHPFASVAALETLRAGGNAVDAAIAACAVLCVVEPGMTGVGGDCFALYRPAGGEVTALNGSGRAPAAATLDWYRERNIAEIGATSPYAVTVPGAVAAWTLLLERHGRKSFDELLRPAIRYAEEGYAVAPRVSHDWHNAEEKLRQDPNTAKRFLPNGRPPKVGQRHAQPELAETLKRIGREGRRGFYEGPVAEDVVGRLNELGAPHTLDDFAAASAEFVEPVRTAYRDVEVHECPPNGQGIAALMILNVLSGFDLSDERLSEADRVHLLAEASKQVYRQRDLLIGDPAQVQVPAGDMLSAEMAERLRRPIAMDKARRAVPWNEPEHKDTTYLCVVDRDGNAISFINSLFAAWGTGIMAPKSGVMLHNRGMSFRLVEGHPNATAPRKRPMHTIIPGMITRQGELVGPFGVMGGHYQATGHANFVSNVVDRGMDTQAAIDAPRSFSFDNVLQLEAGYGEEVAADLAARGHAVTRPPTGIGGGQAILRDGGTGFLVAGSDPRKDGCALGW